MNVAVAWGCALWSPLTWGSEEDPSAAQRSWYASRAPASRRWSEPGVRTDRGVGVRRYRMEAFDQDQLDLVGETTALPENFVVLRIQAGFPLTSVGGSAHTLSRSIEWRSHNALQPSSLLHAERHRYIPVRPTWPGFAVNTIFYGGLIWFLLVAPFALRRFLRRRRGLCPMCAYPLGDSPVCTECGERRSRGGDM